MAHLERGEDFEGLPKHPRQLHSVTCIIHRVAGSLVLAPYARQVEVARTGRECPSHVVERFYMITGFVTCPAYFVGLEVRCTALSRRMQRRGMRISLRSKRASCGPNLSQVNECRMLHAVHGCAALFVIVYNCKIWGRHPPATTRGHIIAPQQQAAMQDDCTGAHDCADMIGVHVCVKTTQKDTALGRLTKY